MHPTNDIANMLIEAYLRQASEEEINEIIEKCPPLWKSHAKAKARQQIRVWYSSRRRFSWCTVTFPERSS